MSRNHEILKAEILAASEADTWYEAVLEWTLLSVIWEREPHTCLCSYPRVHECCYLRNEKTGCTVLVGNCCVQRFWSSLATDKIFSGVRRVMRNPKARLSPEALRYAHRVEALGPNDVEFYKDIYDRRTLSDKQWRWKRDIDQRVIALIGAPQGRAAG